MILSIVSSVGLYSVGLLSCVGGVCVGDEQYAEGAGDGLPPPGSPYYLTDPSQLWYVQYTQSRQEHGLLP